MAQYKHVGKLKYIERSDQTKSFAQRIVSSIMRHDLTDHSPVYYAALTWNNIPGKDARRGLTASIRQLLRESETGDDLDQEYLLEQSLESAAAVFDEYEINDYPPPPQQQQQHQQQLQLLERNPINPRTMGRTLFTGSQITTNMNRTPVITPATTPSLEVHVSPEHHREQKFGASSPVKYLTDRPTVLQRPIPQRPKGGGGGGGSSGDGGGDKRHSGGSSIIELLSEEPRRSSVTSSVRSYSPTENHNNNRNISSSSLSDSSGEYIDAKQQPHLGHLQQQHSQSKLRMMMMYSVMKRSKLLSKPKRHQ
jgi:hypothetical protein